MQNILLNLIDASEKAALAAAKWIGKADSMAADEAAVQSMRNSFNSIQFSAKIVIGEGERDEAPMLHIGEIVGTEYGPIQYDIAVDPLECTTRCANNDGASMTAIVIANAHMLLQAPDLYMFKIASRYDVVSLNASIEDNLMAISRAKGVNVKDLTVAILNRERHQEIISRVLQMNAKIKLISDGDIAAVMLTCIGNIDMYIGIGGAPEGVIASAAISMLGGFMEGKLLFDNDLQRSRAELMINGDIDRIFTANEMIQRNGMSGELALIMTGITSGELIHGVNQNQTETICMYKDINKQIIHRKILTTHHSHE